MNLPIIFWDSKTFFPVGDLVPPIIYANQFISLSNVSFNKIKINEWLFDLWN